MTIIEKLKELNYTTIPAEFYTRVAEWKSWYQGDVKNFTWYRVKTGPKTTRRKRYSLGMAKKLAEDIANLLMNEKVTITLEGEKEQAFVDNVFTANNFTVKANEMQEMKSALGTAAYIPRLVGGTVDENGVFSAAGASVVIDYATVEHIWPLAWDNTGVTECAFSCIQTVNGEQYCYLQIHHKGAGGLYEIENKLYSYKNDSVGDEKALTDVAGFEKVPPHVSTGSDKRQFVIDRLNIANNVDYSLPLGIPIFANAIDILRGVDIAYDSYVNEFVLGKKRIMVKPAATKYLDTGEPIFDPEDVVFYELPEDVTDGNAIQPIDMTLRTAEHNRGIQDQLNMLSSKCGLGESYYQFDGASMATATQVISANSTMFRTIKKHEVVLDSVLKELCRIILRLGNNMGAGLNEDIEISIDYDDSIIEDKAADEARVYQMLAAGLMRPEEARALLMNEDEATAKAALPNTRDLTDEEQNEVE